MSESTTDPTAGARETLIDDLSAAAYQRGKIDAMIELARDSAVTARLADKSNNLACEMTQIQQDLLAATERPAADTVTISRKSARQAQIALRAARIGMGHRPPHIQDNIRDAYDEIATTLHGTPGLTNVLRSAALGAASEGEGE